MVDIHNHILPGIDDGCKTIDDSIKLLKEVELLGITDVCFSPHYVKGSRFTSNNTNKKLLLDELKKLVIENNIKINLYLGNEVYFENDMYSLIKDDEITTINGGRYLLFELPMVSEINNLKEVIFNLKVNGIVPIIAHPERYSCFQKNPNKMIALIEQGCLFQGNLSSIVGVYGKEAQKSIKLMLSHNLIHFLATDVHHCNSKNLLFFSDSRKELVKLIGEDYAKELMEINPLKAINNEIIQIKETKVIKKSFFSFKL